MPTAPGTCPECGVKHGPNDPHNKESLMYQFSFYNKHGHYPTREDAMAHCSEETKRLWKEELEGRGVDMGGVVNK